MSTPRQIEANRSNALKSTGPRSAEGKAVVAQNAVRHGIFCGPMLVEGDDPAELNELVDGFMHDIAPRNLSERALAERIIGAHWRLRRLMRAEQHLHEELADDHREYLGERGEYPGEEADKAACEKIKNERKRTAAEDRIDQRRAEWASEQLCAPGLTLALDLKQEKSAIERYSRYEKRLEGTIHRAWRELRLLRKDAEQAPPSPLQGEGGGEGRGVQTDLSNPAPAACDDLPPHPNPLPQGEREPEKEEMQNKPNSDRTDGPAEVYAEASAMPVPLRKIRPLPGEVIDVCGDATS